jgi:hypothetical protein
MAREGGLMGKSSATLTRPLNLVFFHGFGETGEVENYECLIDPWLVVVGCGWLWLVEKIFTQQTCLYLKEVPLNLETDFFQHINSETNVCSSGHI